ncbi:2-C-methyl-D-erythritol 4-phosphate cytidylyltransferase [Candidatus Blochmannia ocreatus (nom. nud.)]|uniref:2-C-methyl-D-erythritol 4-phosphate cytidylyltransferase n=1 Tax=Candidatus Blochmannia ocreatus (nom. nud.) TaxID=251538 RepID=A0ABY4SY96_9ENTR|nr:2-C-methyl-D-erythritol 4-phosphate cytidylyltransferase [Candidatus Blochmannia ocreatus]URJ25248.1 2-C-methyl-D-erythritol 4-phosphate cytidylyltransferase [Candidatus Blochmannia ocreatus]
MKSCIKKHVKKKFPNITAILPAAGVGKRMQSAVPKQYYLIGNKTLLEYSIDTLLSQSCICHCIVVIHSHDCWFRKLSIAYDPRISIVIGGPTRADSVMAGLQHVKKTVWVIVHDAARPCLHKEDLLRLFEITKFSHIGGILAVPVFNTIKRAYRNSEYIKYTVNRDNLWNALTPQLFNFNILKYCLEKALKNKVIVTDEASAIEYCGYTSILIRGRADNIKVTYQDDLKLASFYLSKLNNTGIYRIS